MSIHHSQTNLRRRTFLAASLAVAGLPIGAQTQSLSLRPVTLVVPFPPGGSVDLIARIYSESLSKVLGTSVVIENRAGAGGSIGSAYVSRAKPDGHTLIISSQSSHVANPLTQTNVGYDPIRDFASISQLARSPNVLVVHPSVPAKNLTELIALLKLRPGELNHCSAGNGSIGRLYAELLKSEFNVKATHVPYQGGGQMLTALLSNEVQFAFDGFSPFLPHIKAGKLRALALTASTRSPLIPDVPTFGELGLPVLNQLSWVGLAAPAKTPKAIVDTLYKAVREVAQQPEIIKRLDENGALVPENQTPAEFTAMMSQRLALYGNLVRRAGIRAE